MPSAHTASEQKRVPATPAPAASIAQVLAPESADGLGFAAGAAEHTPLAAGGSAGEPAWQRRHAALAAYLHRAEAAQLELQHELEALPVRRHAVETRLRCSLCACADHPFSQADALSARASALEQRALFLSCAEADELEHAAGVLGQPVQAGGLGPHLPLPSPVEEAGATRKRGSKRKQASADMGAAAALGVTPGADRA